MKNIILYLILSNMTFVAYSQQINFSGKVSNSRSEPVPNATVYLLNTNRGTLTNADGTFSFKDLPAGKYLAEISSIAAAVCSREAA